MADQQAPAAAPPEAAPPAAAPDPKVVEKLHDHALQAEKHVEQLATGLGQVGADEAALKGVRQMADVLRQIAGSLGKAGLQQARESKPPADVDEATEQMMAERA